MSARYERLLTVDQRPDMYASTIAYTGVAGSDPNLLWWSVEAHFAWLRQRGLTICTSKFYQNFKSYTNQELGIGFYKGRSQTGASQHALEAILPICTTRALINSM